jgi:CHRD domain
MAQNRVGKLMTLLSPALFIGSPALADTVTAELNGFNEVPSLRSDATGSFRATLNENGDELSYTLTYSGIANPTQAHLHVAQPGANGAIAVWLCSNAQNVPTGVQGCDGNEATVEGTINSANVVGPTAQGLTVGDFPGLLAAIGAGVVYANVHSDIFPDGEIRGQLEPAFGTQ